MSIGYEQCGADVFLVMRTASDRTQVFVRPSAVQAYHDWQNEIYVLLGSEWTLYEGTADDMARALGSCRPSAVAACPNGHGPTPTASCSLCGFVWRET